MRRESILNNNVCAASGANRIFHCDNISDYCCYVCVPSLPCCYCRCNAALSQCCAKQVRVCLSDCYHQASESRLLFHAALSQCRAKQVRVCLSDCYHQASESRLLFHAALSQHHRSAESHSHLHRQPFLFKSAARPCGRASALSPVGVAGCAALSQ